MKFLSIKLLVVSLVMLAASSAFAVSYIANVDTSGLNGTSGYLYLQYTPFDTGTVKSTATVSGFTTDGLLGAQSANVVNGSAVTGTLPGSVVFANTNGINDYNQAITFGNDLSFDLLLGLIPGAPAGGSNTFSLGFFSDEGGFNPLFTSDGTLFSIDLNNNGNSAFEVFSNQASVAPVPEPGTIVLLSAGLFGLCIYGKRRIKVTNAQPI